MKNRSQFTTESWEGRVWFGLMKKLTQAETLGVIMGKEGPIDLGNSLPADLIEKQQKTYPGSRPTLLSS